MSGRSLRLRLARAFDRWAERLVALAFAGAILWLLAMPWIVDWVRVLGDLTPAEEHRWLTFGTAAHRLIAAGMLAFWLFALGASLASFLNVVAYRVPRGRTPLGRSRCPYCWNQLTFAENLPVFGWLRHHGRCRWCRLPVSPRYVLVELFLGLTLVGLFAADVGFGRAVDWLQSPATLASDGTTLALRLAWLVRHGLLVSLLLVDLLVRSERFPLPRSLLLGGSLATVAILLAAEGLGIPDRLPDLLGATHSSWLPALATALALAAYGALRAATPRRDPRAHPIREAIVWSWVALACGWLPALVIAGSVAAIDLLQLARGIERPAARTDARLLVATQLTLLVVQPAAAVWLEGSVAQRAVLGWGAAGVLALSAAAAVHRARTA